MPVRAAACGPWHRSVRLLRLVHSASGPRRRRPQTRSRDGSMTSYADFEAVFLGQRSGAEIRDGVPLHTLDALSPEDRARAARALQGRIEEHDRPRSGGLDPWAVEGLGHLAALSTPMPESTVPLLRMLLPRKRGATRATIALALWQMTGDEAMLTEVLALSRTSRIGARLWAMLSRYALDYELIQVIHTLAQFPQPAARRRLEELRRDPRYLVRYNAGLALWARRTQYGISDEP